MRQIIDNTTYNVIASETQYSALSSNDELYLPTSFFLNISVFNELSNIDFITLDIPIIKIDAEKYKKSIETYDVCLKDGNRIVEKGDGMFAFPVPEPAYEDTSLFSMFFNKRNFKVGDRKYLPKLLSPKFILCLLMVDFCNPLDSKHRRQLLKHIPDTAQYQTNGFAVDDSNVDNAKYDLEDSIVKGIKKKVDKLPKHSVEAEFLKYYNHENLVDYCKETIKKYFRNVQNRLGSQDGVDDLVRLADSRRRMFGLRSLSEFDLTFPVCGRISFDAPILEMTPQGIVRPILLTVEKRDYANIARLFDLNFTTNREARKLEMFDPPAYLRDIVDMSSDFYREWSDLVSKVTDYIIDAHKETYDLVGLQYYNPKKVITSEDAIETNIVWTAFPKGVKKKAATDKERWKIADSSLPEYWELLALKDDDKLLELYSELTGQSVSKDDIFVNKKYDRKNKWNYNSNSGNIIHLLHENSTLIDGVDVTVCSSIVRVTDEKCVINERNLTTEQELIKYGLNGKPDRFSDPHIGAFVNKITRLGADVTIRNPPAIYFNDLDTSLFKTPDGSDPKNHWHILRGPEDGYVRASYEVIDGNFCVGDIHIDGVPIDFGAHIADFITMRIPIIACRFGQSTIPPFIVKSMSNSNICQNISFDDILNAISKNS
ncbi:6139_t:CDS:2 [Dentiscutata erythropus]|uniref:6139_t:CDS:1 n=1 Tax=Dentiscutata erythropus TaxID=1348616 RepID=A0A9N9NT87_9GLOM|nr:6139_t:CDS:2 [Dentiscutata erythropus]